MKTKCGRILMIFVAALLGGLALAAGLALSSGSARAAPPSCTVDGDGGADYTTINGAVGNASCLTITVAAGVYTETILLNSRDVILIGDGVGSTIVDGGGTGRALHLANSAVEMSGFTLFNGSASNAGGGVRIDSGGVLNLADSEVVSSSAEHAGGIYSFGVLTLTDVTIMNNRATQEGGGLYNSAGHKATLINTTIVSNVAGTQGGGIKSQGPMTITDSIIAHNTNTAGGGGGIWNSGPMTITNTAILSNVVGLGGGGIYHTNGAMTIYGSTIISGNVATVNGGGIYNDNGTITIDSSTVVSNVADLGDGGGIWSNNGTMTIDGGTIVGNTADEEGGGIYNGAGTMTIGGGSTIAHNTLSPSSIYAGGGIYNSGPMTITNSSVAHNTSPAGAGGGIRHGSGSTLVIADSDITSNTSQWRGGGIWTWGDVVLTNVTIQGNESTSGDGGGIGMDATSGMTATVTLLNCAVIGNVADDEGGGVSTYSANNGMRIAVISNTIIGHNSATHGGGIFNQRVVTLTNSAVISNSAGRGGGIESRGGGSLALTNVTLSGNEANGATSDHGGGGLLHFNGTTDMVNVTIAHNRTVAGDGGGIGHRSGTVNVLNTLITENIDDGGEGPDCYGTLTSQGYNLIGDTTGCSNNGTLIGVISNTTATVIDPLTETMGTLVHPLADGSVAVDHGTDAGCPGTDQRGVGRIPPCDIGAYEVARWVYVPLILRDS
jgi:hypothetical protein